MSAALAALERASRRSELHAVESAASALAHAVHRTPVIRDALRGDWLGHAAHPMLTDFTDGPWMAASFLDLFGPAESQPAARRLVGFGLLTSIPTMLSGLADWSATEQRSRRRGLVHAATSSLATVLYAASYVARRRGSHRVGVGLGLAGGVVAFADGYVGGELSLVERVGTGRRP